MANDLERYLVEKSSALGEPIRATLELTPLCNMNCRMCYIRHSGKEAEDAGGLKDPSFWLGLIPKLKEMGVLFVTLIGGEPFLYPDFRKLYEALYNNGFYLSITTNGTLLAEQIPAWLLKRPPRYMTVSLYGASDDSYKNVTGNPAGFTQVKKGIENLMHANIPVKLNYIMIPENKNDLDAIIKWKEKLGLPLQASAYCFPQIRKPVRSEYYRFTPKESGRYELEIRKRNRPESYPILQEKLSTERFAQDTPKHSTSMYCHAGRSTFWITWQGNMVPCGMMKSISIPVIPEKLPEIWNQLKEQVKALKISFRCAHCKKREVCPVCPAIMEAETGHTDGCPEYLCRMTGEMIRQSRLAEFRE